MLRNMLRDATCDNRVMLKGTVVGSPNFVHYGGVDAKDIRKARRVAKMGRMACQVRLADVEYERLERLWEGTTHNRFDLACHCLRWCKSERDRFDHPHMLWSETTGHIDERIANDPMLRSFGVDVFDHVEKWEGRADVWSKRFREQAQQRDSQDGSHSPPA